MQRHAVAFTPFIPAPRILLAGARPPRALARLRLEDLCRLAGLPSRVTGANTLAVLIHAGAAHYRSRDFFYVGLSCERFEPSARAALGVLEILAHGFHDYAAREQLCQRALFVPPANPGRPRLKGRAMTAAERMRRMRRKRMVEIQEE